MSRRISAPVAVLIVLAGAAVAFGVVLLFGPDDDARTLGEVPVEEVPPSPGADQAQETAPPVVPPAARRASMYRARNLEPAARALRDEVGAGAELLQVSITASRAQFQVRRASDARPEGFNWRPETRRLEPFGVRVVGRGLDRQVFPLSTFRPIAPARVIAGARRVARVPDLAVSSMILRRDRVDGAPRWSFSGQDDDGKAYVFVADADGANVRRIA